MRRRGGSGAVEGRGLSCAWWELWRCGSGRWVERGCWRGGKSSSERKKGKRGRKGERTGGRTYEVTESTRVSY